VGLLHYVYTRCRSRSTRAHNTGAPEGESKACQAADGKGECLVGEGHQLSHALLRALLPIAVTYVCRRHRARERKAGFVVYFRCLYSLVRLLCVVDPRHVIELVGPVGGSLWFLKSKIETSLDSGALNENRN
jgi:hypothetical protein